MNAYICQTIYHLLITIIKQSFESEDIIVISSAIKDAYKYKCKLKESFPRIKVYILENEEFKKGKFGYSKDVMNKFHKLFNNVSNFYFYNSHTSLGFLLHRNKISHHIIEDGYNALKHPQSITPKTIKNKIKFFIENKPRYHGFSKYCLSIEVNDINGLPDDERKNKYIEVPRKQLFSKIDDKKREVLLDLFEVSNLFLESPSVLILTQPLAKDALVSSEEIQFNIYKDVVDKYSKEGYKIYLKSHPRDDLDYNKLDVVLLDKNLPVELIDNVVDKNFDIGITVFSTSLDFLSCVNKKIHLEEQIR